MSKREPKHIGEVMSDIAERYNKLTKTKMSKEELTREDINKQAYLVMSNINAVRITTDIKDKHYETLMNSFMTLQGMFNEYLKPKQR